VTRETVARQVQLASKVQEEQKVKMAQMANLGLLGLLDPKAMSAQLVHVVLLATSVLVVARATKETPDLLVLQDLSATVVRKVFLATSVLLARQAREAQSDRRETLVQLVLLVAWD
jgi:hypothetical protein